MGNHKLFRRPVFTIPWWVLWTGTSELKLLSTPARNGLKGSRSLDRAIAIVSVPFLSLYGFGHKYMDRSGSYGRGHPYHTEPSYHVRSPCTKKHTLAIVLQACAMVLGGGGGSTAPKAEGREAFALWEERQLLKTGYVFR
jgi:hypothetical protein